MVGHQPQAMEALEGGWSARTTWTRRGADGEPVRAASVDSRAAGVHRASVQGASRRVAVLSDTVTEMPARLRGLDSHRQTPRDPRATYSRIGRATRGAQEARIEVTSA